MEGCLLQSLMPCEVQVCQVVPGEPEVVGAPTLNTVLRKPGLQEPWGEEVALEEGLIGADVADVF